MTSRPMADPLPPLRDVIARHGLAAKKSFGQNFLLDLNLTRKIARAAGQLEGYRVYEVGPGPGGLTRALLMEGADAVTAVERDARCLPALEEVTRAFDGRLSVQNADALTIDEAALLGPGGPVRVVANLPYNVGTQLLVKWLTVTDWAPWWASLTLMFQREVADRIVASPGSKAYGRLSVLAQWRCHAERLFDVGPRAFTPPPKVTSAIVHLTPGTPVDPEVPLKALERITAAAFNQRRKMLRASLKGAVAEPLAVLAAADIDPTRRADDLSVTEFGRLAKAASIQGA